MTVGRPPKLLEPDRQERLLALIRNGCSLIKACNIVGVGKTTLHRTVAAADRPGARWEAYRTFRDKLARARDEGEAALVGALVWSGTPHMVQVTRTVTKPNGDVETTVEQRREMDPRSAMFLLERSFGYYRRVEVSGPDGTPVLDPEGLLAAAVARAVAAREVPALAIDVESTVPKEA